LMPFSVTTKTILGRAGNPLPAARPYGDYGAHGVRRPTHALFYPDDVTLRETGANSAPIAREKSIPQPHEGRRWNALTQWMLLLWQKK
jgi:hypothetical protein